MDMDNIGPNIYALLSLILFSFPKKLAAKYNYFSKKYR